MNLPGSYKLFLTVLLFSYTTALASHPSTSEETVIRLNRALAYLQDENFEAALADTQCLSPTSDTSEKALYRAGKALSVLGDSPTVVISCKLSARNTQIIPQLQRNSREPASDFWSSNAAPMTSRPFTKKHLKYGHHT
jgi:hypothetical protein